MYQAPNTDYGQADAWFTAASQNTAGSISTSWGESEILNEAIGANGTEAATYGGIFDEAGLEMAAQGQSAFDASGDAGAYDDAFDPPTPYTELSVDNPANSPWLTAAGGTTEAGQIPIANSLGKVSDINIPAQRAWGWDYLWPYYATLDYLSPTDTTEGQFATDPFWIAGSGGGYSVVEQRPSYQSAIPNIGDFTAVPYLTPTTAGELRPVPAQAAFLRSRCQPPGLHGRGRVPEWCRRRRRSLAPPRAGPCPTSRRMLTRTPDTSCTYSRQSPTAGGRLGRHELCRAAAERLGRGDRLVPASPERVLEPGDLQVRGPQLHAVPSAERGWREQ